MRRMTVMLAAIAVLFLAGCGPGTVETPESEAGDATATAPAPGAESYPSQPTPTPVQQEAYPDPDAAPATPQATTEPTAYPSDQEVWIIRPLGQQCVDASTYEYADLDAAVEALEAAGVEVLAAEETVRPVCQSCDCSTSEHFRVQIVAGDLATVQNLGWFQE